MSLSRSTCVAIDFETSGYSRHFACSLGLARVSDGRVTDTWYSLIKPPSSRIYFTRVHGLTWRELKHAPTFTETWPQISEFIADADCFVAHNAAFDRGVLKGCCEAFGFPYPDKVFLDTLKGARKLLSLSSNSLVNVCAHLGVPLTHHHAGSDALGCALIFLKLLNLGANRETLALAPPKSSSRAG